MNPNNFWILYKKQQFAKHHFNAIMLTLCWQNCTQNKSRDDTKWNIRNPARGGSTTTMTSWPDNRHIKLGNTSSALPQINSAFVIPATREYNTVQLQLKYYYSKVTNHHWGPQHSCWVVSWQRMWMCVQVEIEFCTFLWNIPKTKEKNYICIDLLLHALCKQSLKFGSFIDPEKSRLQKMEFFVFFGTIPKIKKKKLDGHRRPVITS